MLLKPEGGKGWQCKLKSVRGDPPCGQLLSALNPSESASIDEELQLSVVDVLDEEEAEGGGEAMEFA